MKSRKLFNLKIWNEHIHWVASRATSAFTKFLIFLLKQVYGHLQHFIWTSVTLSISYWFMYMCRKQNYCMKVSALVFLQPHVIY